MPNVVGAYCGLDDLRKGDLPLPPYMGDGSDYVKGAAEEIDAALGHIYDTPFVVEVGTTLLRPSILVLKKLNWLIASGRLVLDLAASGENDGLHAYGKRMLDEGLAILTQIQSGEMILSGAPAPPPGEETPEDPLSQSGPMILNEDAESLVESFYGRHSFYGPVRWDSPDPYASNK